MVNISATTPSSGQRKNYSRLANGSALSKNYGGILGRYEGPKVTENIPAYLIVINI